LTGFFVAAKTLRVAGIALLIIIMPLLLAIWRILASDAYYKGIIVENADISGLNRLEAKAVVDKKLEEEISGRGITLTSEGKSWNVSLNEISFGFLTDEALENAYNIGRTGNVFNRLRQICEIRFNNVQITVRPYFDRERLRHILSSIKTQIDMKEKDASISIRNKKIVFAREKIGKELDMDMNMRLIESRLLKRDFNAMELAVIEKAPRILYEKIKEIDGEISAFSTAFNAGDSDRSHNIELACGRIDNSIILPGEIFSMNEALGPRTLENGYREAPVIYKNELVKGAGGGVCQVTTTLYVAVLKARLEVVERSHHSMPLGYVKPGQDATIAEGSIDFKFQNVVNYNRENYPVCISAKVSGNRINIGIWSRKNLDGQTVELKSEIIEEYEPGKDEIIIDDSVPYGKKVVVQEARKGLKAIVYREVKGKDGKLILREKISENVYKPVRGKIKVNSGYAEKIITTDGTGIERGIDPVENRQNTQ